MDTSDPEVTFDEHGRCNHCRSYESLQARLPATEEARSVALEQVVERIKADGHGKRYDCIVGVSGGVDSSYVAYLAKQQFGLRPLAVHCDCGWNSELAVQNIENIVRKLDIDLYTFVCDWDEVRDLQRAFILSGINHADTPQDHAHTSVTYRAASEQKVRWILSGKNMATEGILPSAWGSDVNDTRLLMAIQKKFGTVPLKNFPIRGTFTRYVYDRILSPVTLFKPLDYVPYDKSAATETLKSELEWRKYDGKHHESVFTRFFQGYYLPTRFGFEKRRAHLSSLIASGQLGRDEALAQMEEEHYSDEMRESDLIFVAKKLGMTESELRTHSNAPPCAASDYPSFGQVIRLGREVYRRFPGLAWALRRARP